MAVSTEATRGSEFSPQDLARRRAIDEYGVVGWAPEPNLQGLVELAARLCDVPTAVINIIDERLQHQVAAVGFAPDVCAREDSMCARVIERPQNVVVPDARLDPRFATNPFVTGEIATVRFYASSPLVTPAGVVIGTLCVFDEVPRQLTPTAAGGLEVLAGQIIDVLELRRITAELKRSNEQLSHFAAQVSHDLRNPLAALAGFLEITADSPEMVQAPEASRALARAESSVRRMQSMVSDLLDFASIGGRVARLPVDLQEQARAVVEDLCSDDAEARSAVEVSGLPMVPGDRTLLRVLLQNLVANALKFSRSRSGGVRVTVSASRVAGGWRIAVDDNGPGVPPADRERVFRLLERGTRPDVEGWGIGLSTCQRIVEAHGGRIGIDDSPLGGASVWAVLPD
ncbi:ATP-binding protein [Nostocoides sp. HKS02]|uniref:sensor histidine kinase n=1 Tax=Nostocoides sp. HKS02 TaxID=1813880 RepID=UPI0012B460BD|nr:GAF domain-containing sensor histidine kinase [Tetrasphaera sp. HKS02]QGN58764.1 GAF domain-containing protein [Tetrasphaera sp. HKS02]